MDLDWNNLLAEQLDWHWRVQLRPRLEGLSDDEWAWEPAPAVVVEPVPTIGWRLAHITVDCFEARAVAHFGAPEGREYSEGVRSARGALERLDEAFASWMSGVRGLGMPGLGRACGAAEGAFGEEPLAALVLHVHREVLHHGAEVALLRDLYRETVGG